MILQYEKAFAKSSVKPRLVSGKSSNFHKNARADISRISVFANLQQRKLRKVLNQYLIIISWPIVVITSCYVAIEIVVFPHLFFHFFDAHPNGVE